MRRHKCVRSRYIAVNNTDVMTQGRKDYSIVSASVGYILGTLTLIRIPYYTILIHVSSASNFDTVCEVKVRVTSGMLI